MDRGSGSGDRGIVRRRQSPQGRASSPSPTPPGGRSEPHANWLTTLATVAAGVITFRRIDRYCGSKGSPVAPANAARAEPVPGRDAGKVEAIRVRGASAVVVAQEQRIVILIEATHETSGLQVFDSVPVPGQSRPAVCRGNDFPAAILSLVSVVALSELLVFHRLDADDPPAVRRQQA